MELEQMKRILDRNKEEWMDEYNCKDITIGLKEKNEEITDEICFKFWVEKKHNKLAMQIFNRKELIPKELEFVKTDVKEEEEYEVYVIYESEYAKKAMRAGLTPIVPLRFREYGVKGTKKLRPILMGSSMGNKGTGTSGFLYKKDGEFYILTNAHVAAADPFKYISDQETKNYQPGPYHQAPSDETYIGDMRYMILLNEYGSGVEVIAPGMSDDGTFTQAGYNTADAALCDLKKGVEAKPDILDIPNAPRVKECVVAPGDEIIGSSWRMDGVMEGIVTDIGKSALVTYGDGKQCMLRDLIVTTKFGNPGTSGSGMMRKRDMAAIGLNFAGGQTTNLLSAIQHINTAFGGEIVTFESPEELTHRIDISLEEIWNGEKLWKILGTVTDKKTKLPLEGATVVLDGEEGRTGAEGNYEFHGISEGDHKLTAEMKNYKKFEMKFNLPPD